MRRLLAAATALTLCALVACGGRTGQPARDDPRVGELRQRVETLEEAVRNLQGQTKQAAKVSPEEPLVGNWTPKQAGRQAWLVGLRLEPDRTCRFTLCQPGGAEESFRGSYALVGQQLVIDVAEPMGGRTHQWDVRSLSGRSVVRRRAEGGMWEEVRLQRE